MNEINKEKLLNKDKWLRGLFMLLFCVIMHGVSFLIVLIAIFQFVWDLFASLPNEQLQNFTKSLNRYFYLIINYLTFNTEVKPFPFTSWPHDPKDESKPDQPQIS